MNEYLRRTWAEVDLDAIRENYRKISGCVGSECRIMAIVKADGYGHGAVQVSQALREAGAQWFGVSNLDEALQLRGAGITEPVLILGYTPPEEAERLARYNITQTVLTEEYGFRLSECAARSNVVLPIHIKLDTGMARIGLSCLSNEEITSATDGIERIYHLPGLACEGIFTHFASADEQDDGGFARRQYKLFCAISDELSSRGITFKLRHCCNSAATLHYPEMHMDMVRPGIALYGLYPNEWMRERVALKPAMELKSVVSMVKSVPENVGVSYGQTFTTQRESVLATVPLGYADGYPRLLSSSADMLVCGQRARIAGRVCMDQCVLDVTGIDGVQSDSTVTVFGGEISADELAKKAGTIHYEIVCGIGKRVPRVYINE